MRDFCIICRIPEGCAAGDAVIRRKSDDLCSLHRRLECGIPKRRAVYFSGDTLRNTSVIAADRKKGGRALANYKWHSRAAAAVLACLMTAAALPLSTAFAAKAPSTDTAQTTAVSAEETGSDTGGDLSYEEQETYSDYYDTYRDEPRPEAEILLSGADFQKADCTGYETGSYSDRNGESRENVLVWNSAEGSFSYTLNVPETGLYCVQASYCPIVSNTAEISVSLAIDGEVPYDTASRLKLNKVYQNQSEIKTDDSGNQVRPTQEQTELWQTSWIGDSDGLFNDPVFFYLEKGTHEITLSSQKAYFALESLRFAQPDEVPTYAEYTDSVNAAVSKEDTPSGVVRIEGENAVLNRIPCCIRPMTTPPAPSRPLTRNTWCTTPSAAATGKRRSRPSPGRWMQTHCRETAGISWVSRHARKKCVVFTPTAAFTLTAQSPARNLTR